MITTFAILGAFSAATLGYLLLEGGSEWGGFFGLIVGLPIGAIVGIVLGIMANRSFDKYDAR